MHRRVNEFGGGFHEPLAALHAAGKVEDEQIAGLHLRPVQAERREIKPVGKARHQQRQMIVDAFVEAEVRRQSIARGEIDSGAGLGFRARYGFKTCAHGPSSDKSWVHVQRPRLNCPKPCPWEFRKNMQWVTRAACGAYAFMLALQVSA